MWDGKCSGQGLLELIQKYKKKTITGLEIGCAEGDTTEYLLSNIPNLNLYGVDPYENYVDWNGNNLSSQENSCSLMLEKISPYQDRFIHYREYSDTAASKFKAKSLDFIFIDGLHTYEQVLADCRNYYAKVKSGGIFAGHDYRVIEAVNKAVNEFAQEVGIEQILETEVDVWYWIKP